MPNRLSAFFYSEMARDREPVTVFDVGCSGGVGSEWNIFGPSLRAVGFDPLEFEIERLQDAETRPNVTYEAAFVGLSTAQEGEREKYESSLSEKDKFDPNPMDRSSAIKAGEILSYDYQKEVFNSGADKTYTSRRISLDEFAEQHSLPGIDLLKVDTDGHDVEVLIGAEKLLGSIVLGAKVETFFHGPISPYTNTFSNVDRIMARHGLQLFDVQPRTYTRAALPGPFKLDAFAPTTIGSAVWADVFYLRDLAHPSYETLFNFQATREQIIKSACLMEAWGLSDCAAELIVNRADRLAYPIDQVLDLLVPDTLGPKLSYREYMEKFTADPKALFPSRRDKARPSFPFVTGARRDLAFEHAQCFPHWHANLSSKDGALFVTTSDQAWAYAAALPLPHHQGAGVLLVEAKVSEGQVGVSAANADCTDLAAEAFLSAEDNKGTVMLPLSSLSAGSVLLIRNGSRATRSCVAISRVTLFAN